MLLHFRGKVLKCSGCQYVYYCNRECQTNAWKAHKAECLCLSRATGKIIPDAARVIARIILKLNDGGDAEKGYYTEKFYRKFKDLMSRKKMLFILFDINIYENCIHTDSPDIQNDERRVEHVQSLMCVLQDILTVDLMPNQTEFLAIYGRVRVIYCYNFTMKLNVTLDLFACR